MKIKLLIVAASGLIIASSCGNNSSRKDPSPGEAMEPATNQTEQDLRSNDQADQSPAQDAGNQDRVSLSHSRDAGSLDQSGASRGTIKLTKQDFLAKVMNYEVNQTEWVFEGEKPCLIDFYADWCAPCRISSPILEELAVEYGDRINIYKVDTEKERELAMVFGIQSIPSFLFCPLEGKPVMSAGIASTEEQTREMFRQQINEILLSGESL